MTPYCLCLDYAMQSLLGHFISQRAIATPPSFIIVVVESFSQKLLRSSIEEL
ncbi:hypothetical protein RND71_015651 [Anisodus tanguticus]|uniref:Uncharacterized protein n=1 Tax=Anisodus tanguticus TaxID=243964 RepID=A0AAE1S7T8_9SOLA|nr:hypothetical protein RND71_015651 [Anisodus tanguticus]